MRMQMTTRDFVAILAIAGVLLLSAFGIRKWTDEYAIIVAVILSNIFVLIILFEMHRRAERRQRRTWERAENLYKQTEALFSVYFSIEPSYPLPDTRGWAASPDFLKKLLEIINREKPRFVLEAGAGLSSLVIAYCLKQIGQGKLISIDHDAEYAKACEDELSLHGLEDTASVVCAPLAETEINGKRWLWYDIKRLTLDTPIDLLVIDGPPRKTGRLARYPALPVLFRYLRDGSTIILDDGGREEEKQIVEMWKDELKSITYDYLSLDKGAFLIKKHSRSAEGAVRT